MPLEDNKLLRSSEFKDSVQDVVRLYMKSSAFTDRKLTDTPTDALQVVNRKYVTLNGTTGLRPTAPVTGQFYYDITLGIPIWWNGSNWKDAAGNTV